MGRKSKRNDSNDVAVLNKPLEIFPTAIYARLSVENSGKDDGGAALATQIEICKQYIDERMRFEQSLKENEKETQDDENKELDTSKES